jgi:hypothetical protein
MALDLVTVGSTRRDLVITIQDENGNPVDLTGGAVRLQGRSADLPGTTIDVAGNLTSPSIGLVTFSGIGSLVGQSALTSAGKDRATFRLKIKYTDNGAKVDYTDPFEIIWDEDPLQPA